MPVDEATHVVVGQGYVGLPLAQAMVSAGMHVVGFDTRTDTVGLLNSGHSHIDDISDREIREMLAAGYQASDDPRVLSQAQSIVICVPTPLNLAGEPDLSAVEGATRAVAAHLSPGTLVVLESTTYPGTTEEVLLPILEAGSRQLDVDFYLAFSPERIDPGNSTFGLQNTPKVVGGVTPTSGDVAQAFYEKFVDSVVRTRGAREAETAKLLENTYRHINIALVNEMARFCAQLDIDIWDVIRAASTKPFGFQAFYPGPGVGGHCIPIDPNYLSYDVRRRLGQPFRFVELAEEINSSMPAYVVERVQRILNFDEKTVMGSRVLLLGVTYKADISDERESPAVPVAELLQADGALVSYHDPYVDRWSVGQATLDCVKDLDAAVAVADIVVLLQAHSVYQPDSIAEASLQFFDTRGVTSSGKAIRL